MALACAWPVTASASESALDEQIIADAYVYLIGRALIVRQEHLDVAAQGGYNVAFHNRLGAADFVNPNLGVANTEAWIAVDDATPVLLEIPKIEGRYYTAQILDEWGETLTNIHERNYPLQSYGKFAFVAPGSRVAIPDDAVRIELRSQKAKMLARVELQNDREGAVALQRQIRVTPLGQPKFPPAVKIPEFDHAQLVGVGLFDATEDLLKSAPDVSPIAAQLQAQVRAVALAAQDPAQRAAIDQTLRDQVIPRFQRYATQEGGQVRNNWLGTAMILGNYGEEFWTRSGTNLIGIWANNSHEVIYFIGTRDAAGQALDGSKTYELHFPKDALPQDVVDAFWSIHLVGVPDFMPVPNRLDRFMLSSHSNTQKNDDGSLTLVLGPEPVAGVPEANWLPTSPGKRFSLNWRTYVPKAVVRRGEWFPPAVSKRD
ncbi:MAG: DUF1214 domain-containing protein [Thiobacillus sp.]|nr:DUF1214 domain-containing protein [Thiobacillus sp.]